MTRRKAEICALFALASCGSPSLTPPAPEPKRVIPSPQADDMVDVPAGWFRSGCVPPAGEYTRLGCREQAAPYDVWLSHFQIDRLESTRAQYWMCVDAGACTPPPWADVDIGDRSETLPVQVFADQAIAYCRWREARLPTEAEWQKAARGPTLRTYPWGSDPAECGQVSFVTIEHSRYAHDDRPERVCKVSSVLAPVGAHPKDRSYYGALDMGGNAAEWTSSWDTCGEHEDLNEPGQKPWEYALVDPTIIDPVGLERERAYELCDQSRFFSRVRKGGDGRLAIGASPAIGWLAMSAEDYARMGGSDSRGTWLPAGGIRCARALPGPAPPSLPAEALANRYKVTYGEKAGRRIVILTPSMFTPIDE